MHLVSTGIKKHLAIALLLSSFGTLAEEDRVSIKLDDVEISELSLALTDQTKFRYMMPREVQGISGITLDVESAKLSEVFRLLESAYGLCAWIWQPPEGYDGRNLNEIRWAHCEETSPNAFVTFVPWRYEDDA